MQSQTILHCWFEALATKQQLIKDTAPEVTLHARFGATLEAASCCGLFTWHAAPEGRLAKILVLDQFSRNIFREMPCALAQDALVHAQTVRGKAVDRAKRQAMGIACQKLSD